MFACLFEYVDRMHLIAYCRVDSIKCTSTAALVSMFKFNLAPKNSCFFVGCLFLFFSWARTAITCVAVLSMLMLLLLFASSLPYASIVFYLLFHCVCTYQDVAVLFLNFVLFRLVVHFLVKIAVCLFFLVGVLFCHNKNYPQNWINLSCCRLRCGAAVWYSHTVFLLIEWIN